MPAIGVTHHQRSFSLSTLPHVGHYSMAKFLALDDYIQRGSPWRATFRLLLTPLPGLFAALVPVFIPLQPLHCGATLEIHVHLFVIVLFASIGALISSLVVTKVPTSIYSFREAIVVSLCSTVIHTSVSTLMWRYWRFPTPFAWISSATLWLFHTFLAHLLVLGRKCFCPEITTAIQQYGLGLLLQLLQVALYPAISVLFDHVHTTYQFALMLIFPLIKILIKRGLTYTTQRLKDQYSVVVVAAVEICASMYQSMIMQTAPSKLAIGIIMLIDVVQGFASLKVFLDEPLSSSSPSVPRHLVVAEALKVIRSHHELHPSATPTNDVAKRPHEATIVPVAPSPAWPSRRPSVAAPLTKAQRMLIRQALRAAQAAETILLVEYFEIIVPLLNCVFLLIAAQFQSSFYNTKLIVFYQDHAKLESAVMAILFYSSLQGLSCVIMHAIMKYRYGLSAGYHLAFVLECHRIPIQGKMVAWLPIILHFTTAHYGTDFSFLFQFQEWEQW